MNDIEKKSGLHPQKLSSAEKKPHTKEKKTGPVKTLGPVSDLERHLPPEWWKNLFSSLYLKTDGDVVENDINTVKDIDLLIETTGIRKEDNLLDLCCGQGRHSIELARRGFHNITGIDRSRYLIRLARRRAKQQGLSVAFSQGDARKFRVPESSRDCVFLMGNSFGYFEYEKDDIAVLNAVKKVLTSEGKLALDIVDGEWMAKNFEPRSWEWIDQCHFVNRERTLSSDGKRIVSREVITNSEIGVLADQFYAERIYSRGEIVRILDNIGFTDICVNPTPATDSTRGQDLGMMAHRIFITAVGPVKDLVVRPVKKEVTSVTVLMGDPNMPDAVKMGGKFNEEDLETIRILKKNLAELSGFNFIYMENHKNLIQELAKNPPAFVFNLCDEGYNNVPTLELHIPALLEMFKVPYTGAGPGCLALCYNKAHVRAIAQNLDVDVPMETFFDPSDLAANLPSYFPAILKPNLGDSSVGITQKSVVYTAEELLSYLDVLREKFPGVPVLVQEFLQGPEYSVGLIGNADKFEVLPILEVDYSRLPENLPKILSYESKWDPDSPYWTEIKYKEANLDETTARKLVDASGKLFDRLECRDYARFDFRSNGRGEIKLLEVNPNPGWCWDGKFNLMAGFADLKYHDVLRMILQAAKDRIDPSDGQGKIH
ncbi:MAG: D-alanine--D-alanine ligase [Nitrospinae bacterium CG11_big_fil_rev_8_21_14_0_20_56_8]|nr:MAG: D-alanine--D-alanine ligase [Nitrospinae bacterium CG11_big_fil_rev_8_21_14_0_20_56_8]